MFVLIQRESVFTREGWLRYSSCSHFLCPFFTKTEGRLSPYLRYQQRQLFLKVEGKEEDGEARGHMAASTSGIVRVEPMITRSLQCTRDWFSSLLLLNPGEVGRP